ncbi:hypothetical protein D3C72_1763450 [compost metagenome]
MVGRGQGVFQSRLTLPQILAVDSGQIQAVQRQAPTRRDGFGGQGLAATWHAHQQYAARGANTAFAQVSGQ